MGLGTALAVSAGAAVVGGGVQALGAYSAGKTQASAENNAANVSLQEANNSNALIESIYGQNKSLLQPFIGAGESALGKLQQLIGTNAGGNPLTAALTKPFEPTLAQLSSTPGYKFALQQGELATQAGASAMGQGSAVSGAPGTAGIGASGPLGKGLANYAEGLASQTYQQQFSNYLTQNQQIYNMLAGQVNMGAGTAATLANAGTTAGGQSANALLTGAGQYGSLTSAGAAASAAGIVGATGGISNALTGAGNNALLYGVLGAGGGTNAFTGSTAVNGADAIIPSQVAYGAFA